jgi:hypothetical protein
VVSVSNLRLTGDARCRKLGNVSSAGVQVSIDCSLVVSARPRCETMRVFRRHQRGCLSCWAYSFRVGPSGDVDSPCTSGSPRISAILELMDLFVAPAGTVTRCSRATTVRRNQSPGGVDRAAFRP